MDPREFLKIDLHALRNRADYQLDKLDVEQPATALAALRNSTAAIETLDRKFSGLQTGALKTAIAAWRRANGYP
jgi:hypothetical protein